jgi:hypothetical protein
MLPAVSISKRVFLNLIGYFDIEKAIKLPKNKINRTLGIKIIKVLMK